MAIRPSIDANETEGAIAWEESPGKLPGVGGVDAVWTPLEPNSWPSMGGSQTKVARRFISSDRMEGKGREVDFDAAASYVEDLTFGNSPDMIEGFMHANFREKPFALINSVTATEYNVDDSAGFVAGQLALAKKASVQGNNGLKLVTAVGAGTVSAAGLAIDAVPATDASLRVVGRQAAVGDIDVDASGALPALTSTTLDFTTLGLNPGEWILVGGEAAGVKFTTAANNGFKRVRTIAANRLTFDQSAEAMVTEANTTSTIQLFFGSFIKNERGPDIVNRTAQIERKLGAPDDTQPAQIQAEYSKGCYPNVLTMTVENSSKIEMTYAFLGRDVEYRTAAEGPKPGTREVLEEYDFFNTSTDFCFLRMTVYDPNNEAPEPLFAHFENFTLTISNNYAINKGVGTRGGFSARKGLFQTSIEADVYFQTVSALIAARNDADVTWSGIVAFDNVGIAFDIPLTSVQIDDGLSVELDDAIKASSTVMGAKATKIDTTYNHVMSWVYFHYLPDWAETIEAAESDL